MFTPSKSGIKRPAVDIYEADTVYSPMANKYISAGMNRNCAVYAQHASEKRLPITLTRETHTSNPMDLVAKMVWTKLKEAIFILQICHY